MDPVLLILAGKALQLVSPYLATGGEKIAESLGEGIGNQVREALGRIRARFRSDPARAVVLERYAVDPQANEGEAKVALAEAMDEDAGFRAEIERDVNRFGSVLSIVQRIKDGEEVTGVEIQQVKSGLIQVHQEVEKGKNVVGAKIHTFGG